MRCAYKYNEHENVCVPRSVRRGVKAVHFLFACMQNNHITKVCAYARIHHTPDDDEYVLLHFLFFACALFATPVHGYTFSKPNKQLCEANAIAIAKCIRAHLHTLALSTSVLYYSLHFAYLFILRIIII